MNTFKIFTFSLYSAFALAQAELPRISEVFCLPDSSGYIKITVGPVGRDYVSLQEAIDKASPGTVIELDAGYEFLGSFILRKKNPSDRWIIIQTSATHLISESDDRIRPFEPTGDRQFPLQRNALAKLTSIHPSGLPTIKTEPGASKYWMIGLEITIDTLVKESFGLVNLGETGSGQQRYDQVPDSLCLDRCYIHGHDQSQIMKYGVRLDCSMGVVMGCHISQFHSIGFDAQAISGINGPGPFIILDNYLEGSGENILFGGGTPSLQNLVPSDIIIKYNHFYKPWKWWTQHPDYAGKHWTIKNLFELKTGRRVLLEGNILENCWADLPIGQSGYAILLTVRNQNGDYPEADVSDITIRYNIIRNTGAGISISGSDDGKGNRSRRIDLQDNLFYNIDGRKYGDGNQFGPNVGTAFHLGEPESLNISHNTVMQDGSITWAYKTMTDCRITNNLFQSYKSPGSYQGIYGPGVQQGQATFSKYFPDINDLNRAFDRNVLIGGNPVFYSNFNNISKNYFPSTVDSVGFVDFSGGISNPGLFALSTSSPFYKKGNDGMSIGADMNLLMQKLQRNKPCNLPSAVSDVSSKISSRQRMMIVINELNLPEEWLPVKEILVFSSEGKSIRRIRTEEKSISVSGLAPGVYYIYPLDGKKSKPIRIVKL